MDGETTPGMGNDASPEQLDIDSNNLQTDPAVEETKSPAFSKQFSELDQLEETHFIENQRELVALQRLDDKCAQLQQEGRYTDALECMEKGLVLRQHFFGADSDEVWTSCRTVGEMCNLLAMTYLQQEEFRVVLELLKKAEILTERHPAGRAVTLNNLACYYRRQGNLHKALTYLTEALKIESRLDNLPNKADTHLNMCAVLSQLGKHQSALGHAQSALIFLHEELQLGRVDGTSSPTRKGLGVKKGDKIDPNIKLDRVAVLGIAYHNVGVEQEFLKCWDLSLQSYKKGMEITSTYLGEAHGIVITLQNSLLSAKRSMASKIRTAGTRGDGISLPAIASSRGNQAAGIKTLVIQKKKSKKAIRAKEEYPTKLPLAYSNNGSSSTRL
ncbi:Kinesin light chain [Phytophthora citrophthora]|uniref:Kinesin light chain n=1 Tax=Phytophthora citrophthora TaxID=4793 RepID=A0AAD9LD78_9STRA|nr:Kinesin light chain [Phytophthora citrophthora]